MKLVSETTSEVSPKGIQRGLENLPGKNQHNKDQLHLRLLGLVQSKTLAQPMCGDACIRPTEWAQDGRGFKAGRNRWMPGVFDSKSEADLVPKMC